MTNSQRLSQNEYLASLLELQAATHVKGRKICHQVSLKKFWHYCDLADGVVCGEFKVLSEMVAFHMSTLSSGCSLLILPVLINKYRSRCYLHGGPGWSSGLPAVAWPSPGSCDHLGSELVDGNSLSTSPSLSVTLPLKQINLKLLGFDKHSNDYFI